MLDGDGWVIVPTDNFSCGDFRTDGQGGGAVEVEKKDNSRTLIFKK